MKSIPNFSLNIYTIHPQAAEEKQNGFPFRFDFRKGNSFNERGGCTEKHKNGNKVFKLSYLIWEGRRKWKSMSYGKLTRTNIPTILSVSLLTTKEHPYK